MNWSRVTPVLVLLAALAAGYAVFSAARVHAAPHCDVCGREVHAHSRTEGLIGGREESFCCPACALTAASQRGEAVRITRFTDFLTGQPVPPQMAYLVRDSDVTVCARSPVMLDETKHAHAEHFDRCSPSLVAFADREEARSFVALHGGQMIRLAALTPAR